MFVFVYISHVALKDNFNLLCTLVKVPSSHPISETIYGYVL